MQNPIALCGRTDPADACVIGVTFAFDQAVLLQANNEARHRWRAHLLRVRELPDRERSAKHDDGEGGGAGRREPARLVLLAQAAQEMNRSRVDAIGEGGTIGRRAHKGLTADSCRS